MQCKTFEISIFQTTKAQYRLVISLTELRNNLTELKKHLTELRSDLTQKTGFFTNLTKSAKW